MSISLKSFVHSSVAMAFIPLFSATLACSQGAKTGQDGNVLQTVVDIPMPGRAVRFDYQSLDATIFWINTARCGRETCTRPRFTSQSRNQRLRQRETATKIEGYVVRDGYVAVFEQLAVSALP